MRRSARRWRSCADYPEPGRSPRERGHVARTPPTSARPPASSGSPPSRRRSSSTRAAWDGPRSPTNSRRSPGRPSRSDAARAPSTTCARGARSRRATRDMAERFRDFDVLLLPTTAQHAPLTGQIDGRTAAFDLGRWTARSYGYAPYHRDSSTSRASPPFRCRSRSRAAGCRSAFNSPRRSARMRG